MIDTLTQVLTLINNQLGHRTAVLALLVGFGFSVGLTQYIKKRPDVRMSRSSIRALAFVLAALSTWALWPEPGISGIVVGLCVGLTSPLTYTVVVRIAVHRWAWLDPIVSADANPKVFPKEPEEGGLP